MITSLIFLSLSLSSPLVSLSLSLSFALTVFGDPKELVRVSDSPLTSDDSSKPIRFCDDSLLMICASVNSSHVWTNSVLALICR